MRELELDPQPSAALDAIWNRNPRLAEQLEVALDWIESDPVDPRARRRRFSNGMWVIGIVAAGEDWTLVWDEEESGSPIVRLIVETTSI